MTIDIEKIKAAALDALDELDNCARMECSVEPIGAMNHLTNFVQTVCERLEAAERDAERWKTFESVAKDLVFHRNEKGDASRDYWCFGPNQSGLQYIYPSVETAMDTMIKYREQ